MKNGQFTEIKKLPGNSYGEWIHHKFTVQNGVFSVELSRNNTVFFTCSVELTNFQITSSTKFGIDIEWYAGASTKYKNIQVNLL